MALKQIPRSDLRLIATLLIFSLLSAAGIASAADVYNLTGLPIYPHLNRAKMDSVADAIHIAANDSSALNPQSSSGGTTLRIIIGEAIES